MGYDVKKPYMKPVIETDEAFEVLAGCGMLDATNPTCDPYNPSGVTS
jgi:hypothetical protein